VADEPINCRLAVERPRDHAADAGRDLSTLVDVELSIGIVVGVEVDGPHVLPLD